MSQFVQGIGMRGRGLASSSWTKTAIDRIDTVAKQRNILKNALPFLRQPPITWNPKDTKWNTLFNPQHRLEVFFNM